MGSADPFFRLFIILLIYVCTLLCLRFTNYGRKKVCGTCNNCCPDCEAALNRVQRLLIDKIFYHLTFRIFDFKRYICNDCGWEGLRWEDKFRPRGN